MQQEGQQYAVRLGQVKRALQRAGGAARLAQRVTGDCLQQGVELHPEEQLVGYELAHYALRQPGMEPLARRQYAEYLEAIEELLSEAAKRLGAEWTAPVPVLARYVHSVLDGLTMCWIVDRNSEHSREVLRLAGEHLLSFIAEPA